MAYPHEILRVLRDHHPEIQTELKYSNPLELLIAVILSAQCTDKRVNIVTADLFQKYRTVKDYASVTVQELAYDIRSINFFNTKAKHITVACQKILHYFNGTVPRTMQELITLPGVGRKTANVILHAAFSVSEGIAVDTHVKRLSHRWHLSMHAYPDKIEQDLLRIYPPEEWRWINAIFVLHGRYVCTARKPKCDACCVNHLCPSAFHV